MIVVVSNSEIRNVFEKNGLNLVMWVFGLLVVCSFLNDIMNGVFNVGLVVKFCMVLENSDN